MFRNIAVIAASIMFFIGEIIAGTPISGALYMPILNEIDAPILAQENSESEEFPTGDNELFDSGKHRSVKTSFLLSLGLPGAGELYAGNYIKAGAFFAVEVASWTCFAIYQGKGNDGEEEYRIFADDHWEFDYYYPWFLGFGDDSIYTEQLPVDIHVSGSDTTYTPDKTHDYYEMIGKYDWFILGWEDLPNRDAIRAETEGLSDAADILRILKAHENDSELRIAYMDLRKETNDYFTYAKYFVGVALFNHVLSSFDAAWTAKRANDRLYEGFTFSPGFEMNIVLDSEGNPSPKIALNLARF